MNIEILDRDKIDFNEQFARAYGLLENTPRHAFITGKAGTGKSTLLQYFREHTSKNVVVLAPTGVAAVNVRGQTIHSFFRFKPDVTPESVPSIRIRKAQRKLYQKIDTIVIDEISMVRADLLDCVDVFLRLHGKDPEAPFGGVQMIFIGDLFQLPPVVSRDEQGLFREHYPSPYFFDAKSFAHLEVEFIEFKKIYRQIEEEFIRLLGTIRNKTANEDDLKRLNQRFNPRFIPPEEEFYISLTTTNALADRINQHRLNALDGESFYAEGEVTGDFNLKSLPTKVTLELKKGAQVMLLNNDPQGRWINGSIGKITHIDEDSLDLGPIRVELADGTGVDVTPFTWEMFRFKFNKDTEAIESESVGSFNQYPLRLAWAVTIHKSQGKTFTKVMVDFGYGTFSHGQAYVALSRCTSLEGLVLKTPIRRQHILLDERIVNFMKQYHMIDTTRT